MVVCLTCGRCCLTTVQEEIKSCPYCSSDGWHIFHLKEGRKQTYMPLIQAIKRSKNPPRDPCFLTPISNIVPLHQMRIYELTGPGKEKQKGPPKPHPGAPPAPPSGDTGNTGNS